jgi:hypothetical protein
MLMRQKISLATDRSRSSSRCAALSRMICLALVAGCSQSGAEAPDGGSTVDGAQSDADLLDGGVADAPDAPDAPVTDASVPDSTGPLDAPIMVDAGPTSHPATGDGTRLSEQGVYGDFATRLIPSDAITYTPRWELWSDGATKRRWILLPPGSKI